MKIFFFSEDLVMNFGVFVFFLIFSMLLFMLIISIRSLFIKKTWKKFEPSVSVVIPMHNEAKNISACLNSVLNSRYNNKIEIICVDDGSVDNTVNVVKKLRKKHKNIKLISEEHKGKVHALNVGVLATKYDYIMTVDADTTLDKKFMSEVIKPFSNKNVGATNGIILIHNEMNLLGTFEKVEYHLNNLIRNSFSKVLGNGIWFFGAAACFNKKILKKAGLFSASVLTEDMDISLSIYKLGYQVITVENAIYYTNPNSTLLELVNQRMRWFYGGLQSVKKHIALMKSDSWAIKFLYFSQYFWAVYSVLIIPLVVYQVFYWMPKGALEIIYYLFRWFTLLGPSYVIYKIPEWGLSLLNIFGVCSGIISTFTIIIALRKERFRYKHLFVIFFYFPYTLLLNFALVVSLIKYGRKKTKYFLK